MNKTVYLVRHGESEHNNGSARVYTANSPLSELGKIQTIKIAQRVKKLPVDIILSSPLSRAHETALQIGRETGKLVETSPLFVERRFPTSIEGCPIHDAATEKRMDAWGRSLVTEGQKIEDGECFDELKIRAVQALVFLEKRDEAHIVVATHGFFLRVLVLTVLFGENLSGNMLDLFFTHTKTANTGLTVLQHNGKVWKLLVWNDHAHLG